MQALATPSRRLLLVAGAAAALALGIAQAQTQPPAPTATPASAAAPAAAAAPQLSIRDIYDRMEAAGYRDMREIEFDNGRYKVKARNAQGERVKLDVNAGSGKVERERKDR